MCDVCLCNTAVEVDYLQAYATFSRCFNENKKSHKKKKKKKRGDLFSMGICVRDGQLLFLHKCIMKLFCERSLKANEIYHVRLRMLQRRTMPSVTLNKRWSRVAAEHALLKVKRKGESGREGFRRENEKGEREGARARETKSSWQGKKPSGSCSLGFERTLLFVLKLWV